MSDAMACRSRRSAAPRVRLSCTVIPPHTSRPCGTCTSPRATMSWVASPSMRAPFRVTVPLCGATSPLSTLRVVVFPEPLPPSSATIDRSGTWNDTSRSTWVAPYETLRCWTSSIELLAEVGLDHGRVATDLSGRALGDLPAIVEDGHAIGYFHDEPDDVLDHDDGDAVLLADLAQQRVELGDAC